MQINLAVDIMSGDLGPRTNIAGALLALVYDPNLCLHLVGDKELLNTLLLQHHLSSEFAERIQVHPALSTVSMDADPAQAVRKLTQSSMHLAVKLVASGQCQGVVSSGNTGALMLVSRRYLGMLPGIDRPAICTSLPTRQGFSYLLDLGANTSCTPEHLLQFALMGSVMVRQLEVCAQPRVALLNIGHEATKGTDLVKQAAHLLSQHPDINYQGYIEADKIFAGQVDLVVCDGFTGNIALKAGEGTVRYVFEQLNRLLQSSWYGRCLGWLARPLLRNFKQQMDPVGYNGGSFLGLQGCVIKSHGNVDAQGFATAILRAGTEVRQGLAQQLQLAFTSK